MQYIYYKFLHWEFLMFEELKKINMRPAPFQFYTAEKLWTDEHTSKKMLEFHLNETIDISSRNKNFIKHSVKWIISYFNINGESSIADFGCGPGLYTIRMADTGAKITGIDFSKRSINYAINEASKKGLKIDYINKNYLDFETDNKFDLIIMIMCDFCALSPKQRKLLLNKFYKFLKPGGKVLLDVYSINSFNQKTEQAVYEYNQLNGFWSPNEYYTFLNTFKYVNEKVILDKYTIVEKTQTKVIYNWLQYFSRESIIKVFEENGFIISEIFSDAAGTPYSQHSTEIAVVAKKS